MADASWTSLHTTDPVAFFEVRNDPPPNFIAEMQRRFPTDRELDRMLVSKLERRSSESYVRMSLEEFVRCLDALLRDNVEGYFEIANARWLTGGASKMQLGCELRWTDPERGPVVDQLVVRMDPAESLNATSRRQEAEVLRAVMGALPVPRVFWLDADARWFPQPALVYEFAPGVTKPTVGTTGAISGLGTVFGPRLRPLLAGQFIQHLAALHTLDIGALDLPSFDHPEPGTSQAAEWKLNQYQRVWEEDRGEDFPLVDVAASWLRRNMPVLDHVSVVHGDYRSGNFLFDEESGDITAWLDWEYCHLGDRHRDLAWVMDATFGHVDRDSGDYLVTGLCTEAEFLERYEEVSGLPVDRRRLTYYKVANTYQLLVATLATAYRIAGLGKTHQDVMLSWVKGMVPVLSRQLLNFLQKEL